MSSFTQPVRRPTCYARTLGGATEQRGVIVYARFREAPVPSPDLIAGVGVFPLGHRPTDEPGQVLADPASALQFWTCGVRRDQLAHYERITRAEAVALYPRLEQFVTLARAALETTGDLPLSG